MVKRQNTPKSIINTCSVPLFPSFLPSFSLTPFPVPFLPSLLLLCLSPSCISFLPSHFFNCSLPPSPLTPLLVPFLYFLLSLSPSFISFPLTSLHSHSFTFLSFLPSLSLLYYLNFLFNVLRRDFRRKNKPGKQKRNKEGPKESHMLSQIPFLLLFSLLTSLFHTYSTVQRRDTSRGNIIAPIFVAWRSSKQTLPLFSSPFSCFPSCPLSAPPYHVPLFTFPSAAFSSLVLTEH